MTGSASDPLDWQPHIRNKARREALAKRFRDPADPFQIVIVRDMWLTGFDAPCLHTMYVDKPMRGHGLMQAIARVNRVFRDKPGGLVVDYLGLADELKQALATYTESGGTGETALDQDEAVAADAGEVRGLLRPVPRLRLVAAGSRARRRSAWRCCRRRRSTSSRRRTARTDCCRRSRELSQAFALAVPHDEALRIRDDVGVLPGGAGGAGQARAGRAQDRRGARPRDPADRLARRRVRRGGRHLRRRRPARSPTSRSCPTSSWPRCGACRSATSPSSCCRSCSTARSRRAAQRNVVQARSFAEMLEQAIRTLPEPRHRDGAGDRGADRSSPRTCARPTRAARSSA